ncbi:MAG: heme biosynthesis protein HemY [Alphaproteobacteria bacterium]|nr:heme biosynthesis protein HemY [Alphaproteobacteria bacterium]
MIRALLVLIKIGVLVAVVVWLAERPGTVTLDWMDYHITAQLGLFLIGLLGVVMLGMVIFGIIKGTLDMPQTFRRYREFQGREKGLRALGIGLAAVAAGDAKNAAYQAHRARKFMPNDAALPLLLEAQAARLQGREADACQIYAGLLQDKDAGFLGLRGLLQAALDAGDDQSALELGYKALETHPKQGWILRVVYDLEIRMRDWAAARTILYRAEKAGAIPVNKANSDRVAMYLAQADQAQETGYEEGLFRALVKAYKLDKHFVPTVERLGKLYLARGKRKAALSMIEEAWRICPHPALVELWELAMPKAKSGDTMARVRWYEKLAALHPESTEGLVALAGVLVTEGLWGEARKALETAEAIHPGVSLYKTWARLEERATQDEASVREWLGKAADAPRDKVWICSETGRIYERWVAVSDQGLFNTIVWDYPTGRYAPYAPISGGFGGDVLMIGRRAQG